MILAEGGEGSLEGEEIGLMAVGSFKAICAEEWRQS